MGFFIIIDRKIIHIFQGESIMDAVLGLSGILFIVAAVVCIIVFGIILIVKASKNKPKKGMVIALGSSAGGLVLGIILFSIGLSITPASSADNYSSDSSVSADVTDSSSHPDSTSTDSSIASSSSSQPAEINRANHNVNWSLNKSGTVFSIDQIYIEKKHLDSADGSGSGYDGAVVVHMTIKNGSGKDITTYPTQGTILTSTGQQADADTFNGDAFDGDIMSGATNDGNILFPIKKLSDPNSVKSVRIQWQLWPDKNDPTNASDLNARISF
jgi:hypothetical protein